MAMNKLLGMLWLCLCCIACQTDNIIKPYSYLNIKFIEDEDYIMLERIEGSWENEKAHLEAFGYKNEHFHLDLSPITVEGRFTDLSINNIYFNDGADFTPSRLDSGFIEISNVNATQVGGSFRVVLENHFNGIQQRTLEGKFLINIH